FLQRVSGDPRNNEYDRIFYRYGYVKPGVSVTYNKDDGVFLGARLEAQTHGFRKEPFSQRHVFNAGHALRTSSYFFTYDGDFTKAVGINDLLIRADLRAPVNVTNFFGIGNNTTYNRSLAGKGLQYYRARYNIGNLSVMLRRHLQSWMRISYGPTFQFFHVNREQNKDKFLGREPLQYVDAATLYNRKVYAGGEFRLDINSKNSETLPTRGFKLDAGAKQLFGLNATSRRLTQLHWDMSIFASFTPRSIAVYAARLGWAKNIGAFEIPQANYLSGTENLRGYRRNRFAGREVLYNNLELRIRVAEFSTYLFPGSLGILLFNDVGRVWVDEEQSRRWHHGYGGGIWVAPIKRWVVTASVAHSREENLLPYVSVGFRF
ncbi:MAG: BamA/TamA family outer membrane protein, partial [Bacteroidota bacterium]|nr:BamA/TamA family outer membrane protein [Bacteroidota bacterium]